MIIQKQVIKEYLFPLIFSVVVLTFIMLMDRMFILADFLIKKGIKINIVLEIALYSLPYVLGYILPVASLIAGISTFGRLSQDNEIIALKVSGINITKIIKIPILFMIFLSIFMCFFNNFLWPESEFRIRNLLTDLARKKPQIKIREGIFFEDFSPYVIYIGYLEEKTGKMQDILIFKKEGEINPLFIFAQEGILKEEEKENYFTFLLKNGKAYHLEKDGKAREIIFETTTINIPYDDELIRRERTYRSIREMNAIQLFKNIKEVDSEIKDLKKKIKDLKKEKINEEVKLIKIKEEETKLKYKIRERERFLLEFHKKTALAFANIFFLIFGIALGLIIKKGSIGISFIFGLVYFAFYYILLLLFEEMVLRGKILAFFGIWLPTVINFPFAFYFLYKKIRE
ncbi:MAG: LptF/LptG family permease [candidate division WOR-3 bacterium]|nr:LptF/LptG family permease [candidate division WOR-3 bacterium]MCX7837392.1 LptF/LptG family permease [candidate division WOR-3 bacterium]MDW8114311.1 LptF/LptG family permease [candidate division WOR-3 bacterium]